MKLALFDIDGVLADDRHRVSSALSGDWATYFNPSVVALDLPYDEARDAIAEAECEGFTIGYLTGRRSALRLITESWLDDNQFPMGRLIMREPEWHVDGGQKILDTPTWPATTLADFKVQTLVKLRDRIEGLEDLILYDDDPEVVRLVNLHVGSSHAVHCTWHIKPEALVKRAQA